MEVLCHSLGFPSWRKEKKKYPSFLFTFWLRGPLNTKISVPLTYKSSPFSFRHVVCKSKVMWCVSVLLIFHQETKWFLQCSEKLKRMKILNSATTKISMSKIGIFFFQQDTFTAVPFHHNSRSIENSALAFQTKNAWKFPGGLSDLGENIGECPAQRAKERKKEKKLI